MGLEGKTPAPLSYWSKRNCFLISFSCHSKNDYLRGLKGKLFIQNFNPLNKRGFYNVIISMRERKKFYLTEEGLVKIKREYEGLKNLRSAKTKTEVPSIWHSEDVNVEYLSFQEDLSFVETRLAELEYILKNTELIKVPPKEKQNIIDLGAKVLVEADGQEDEFEIVGTLEANPAIGKISNESPVGRALLGHKVGDEVLVSSSTQTIYKIKKIKYQVL